MNADKAALVTALREHLRRDERAGAIVVRTISAGAASTIECHGVNVSRHHMKTAAEEMCAAVLQQLRTCECGADHSLEIARMERAPALLTDPAPEGAVLQ